MNEVLGEKELRSQVGSILKGKQATVLAIRTRAQWSGGSLSCDNQTFEVCQIRSVLEFYERVTDAEDRDARLVCLTELEQSELGTDLLCRLFRRRLHSVDPWTAIKSRFQAEEVEASLVPQVHLARALIEVEPLEGFSKVRGRVLTADKVWSCLFAFALGMPAEYLDAHSLLQWSHSKTNSYREAPEELKESARGRVLAVCGGLGQAILSCVDDGRASPLAVGLALRCVYGVDGALDAEQDKAAARLESFIGNQPLPVKLGREWAQAAEQVVEQDPDHEVMQAAEEFLSKLQLTSHAHISDLLPIGLEMRITAFGQALGQALDNGKKIASVDQHATKCRLHRGLGASQHEQLEMIPRLLRWLHQTPSTPSDRVEELARRYAYDTAFVDWARLRSEGGHNDPNLGQILRDLGSRVVDRLETESRAFASALQTWKRTKDRPGLIGVEDVVSQVVLPLASGTGARVLWIVLDGCSWGTMHEILRSLGHDWTLRQPETGPLPLVLATYPSVTEFSRTSLLCGRLTGGTASTETQGVRDHGGLRAVSSEGYPPVVFHKGDLDGDFGLLAGPVESKISQTKNKVVAVVLNAIDDHLDRDDQIVGRWTVDSIKYLGNLLSLARSSGRTVLMTSDHGHVLERGGELRKGDKGGARWQVGRDAAEGEVQLDGSRVLCEGASVVMPWTEKLRYSSKKNGYHGGAHPRELLAPLVVLAPLNKPVAGWVEVRHDLPMWWDPAAAARPGQRLNYKPKAEPSPTGQLALFTETVGNDSSRRILEFPLVAQAWKAQKNPQLQDWASQLLKILEQGGRLGTVSDLSLALEVPEARFRHLLGQLGPLLTVDGVPMVGLTADAMSVFLNPKPVEDLPDSEGVPKKGRASRIELETTNGELLSFEVPAPTLAPIERQILESLARHGSLTETQLKKVTGTKRVGGAVEKLMEKLHKAGFSHLAQVGEGSEGRIYVLRLEAIV